MRLPTFSLVVIAPLLSMQTARAKGLEPSPLSRDVFVGKGDALAQVQDSQIVVLERLLVLVDLNDPDRADILFRIADLCTEKKRFHSFRARELDEAIFLSKNKQAADGARLVAKQKEHEKAEQKWLLAAVKYYLTLAHEPSFAGYPRMDEVLYSLADLLSQVHKAEQAQVYFRRLIRDYPKSRFLPHAFLSFAESAFEGRRLEDAIQLYDRVLSYGDGPLYGYALYKKGWVYYNLADFGKALASYGATIDWARSKKKTGDRQLLRQARKDLVRAYANVGSAERAFVAFSRYTETVEEALVMQEALAQLYHESGKFADSTKCYRELIRRSKKEDRLCLYQGAIVKNSLALAGARPVPDVVREVQRLSSVYDHTGSRLTKDALEECRTSTRSTLFELATTWHKEAQKTKDLATYEAAGQVYNEFFARFPNDKDSATPRYFHGELFFALGTQTGSASYFCQAAPIYDEVVKAKTGDQASDAAYAAVVSWERCQKPEAEGHFVAAMEVYLDHEKQQKTAKQSADALCGERAVIAYRYARTFYLKDQLEKSVPLFREVTQKYASCPQGLPAANLLLDALSSLRRDSDLLAEISRLRADAKYAAIPEAELPLQKVEINLLRREIEDRQKAGQHKEAGILYMDLARRYPNYPALDELYANAAVNFEKARLIGLAISARELLLSKRPDSPHAKRAVFRIGQNYHSLAAFEQAAERYETFAERYPGELGTRPVKAGSPEDAMQIDAARALRTAAFFRRGLGEQEQALADTKRFLRTYGGHKDMQREVAEVAFEQAIGFEPTSREQHLRDYLRTWGNKDLPERRLYAEVLLGEALWRKSCKVPGVHGVCMEVQRVRSSSTQVVFRNGRVRQNNVCGPQTKSTIVLHGREPSLVREAQSHFAEAERIGKELLRSGKLDRMEEARVRYHLALSQMAHGDQGYESMLAMKIPAGLNFARRSGKAEVSKQRLRAWYEGRMSKLNESLRVYRAVITEQRDAHHAIAAAARIGQLYQDLASALYTAPLPVAPVAPAGIKEEEWRDLFRTSYCDALVDLAEPIEETAVQGLGACLGKATELGWYNEWSQLCEEELHQLRPRNYPLAAEIRPQPGYLVHRMELAPLEAARLQPLRDL